jgi:hypothetical protein
MVLMGIQVLGFWFRNCLTRNLLLVEGSLKEPVAGSGWKKDGDSL